MGRKSKNTSIDLRKLVISHYKEGKSFREIGEIVKRSHSTVQCIIKRFREENRVVDMPKMGPKKLLNAHDERWILRQVKKNPKISAPKLTANLENYCGKSVSPETVRRVLRNNNYNGRIARKKTLHQ